MSRIYSIAMTLAIWLALVSAAVNHALAGAMPAAAEMESLPARAFPSAAPGPDAFSAPGDAMKYAYLRDASNRVDRV